VFKALKQHLTFRGSSIEEIFLNIKGLGKYKDENLAPEEFYAVFLSVDFKVDKNQLWDILDTMSKDSEGKVSYIDFSNDYKKVYEVK
jgi:Ca2+-binding EF-hand superfamily protein